jgi:hypothetical protein
MTSTVAASRALAIESRDGERDELLGIAVLLPSEEYAAVGARIAPDPDGASPERAGRHEERRLTANAWNEIEAWVSAGDAGLPARPAPLPGGVMAELFGGGRAVVGQRVASIPIPSASRADAPDVVDRLLKALVTARR